MKIHLTLAVFLIGLALAVLSGEEAAGAPPGEIQKKVDAYLRPYLKTERFSGSVLMARGGKVLMKQGYGMANYELGVANTPRTIFRLGSLTKQFTALAILQLMEQKRLSLTDSLHKYIPDYPHGDRITIHHLLTHTAGIPNFTAFPEYREIMILPHPLEKIIERFKERPLDFTAGEKFSYSNSGYILLSDIIEKASGKAFEAVLRENIFQPLRMKSTGYDHTEAVLPNRASGYVLTDEGLRNAPYMDMSIPVGGGALFSTVEDLYRWDRALYTEKLLSRESLNRMFTPWQGESGYGYGWMMGKLAGRQAEMHTGGINGFHTFMARFPGDEGCVIALNNIENAPIGRIGADLAAILIGDKYEIPPWKTAPVDPAVFDAYAGRYEFDGRYQTEVKTITVRREGDRLMAQIGDQLTVRLYPESPTKFFMKLIEGEVLFFKNGEGAFTHLLFRQNGQNLPAQKVQ